MYVIYDDAGTITATVMGPDENYGSNVLDKNNQKWIFLKATSSLDPRVNYIDVATKQLMRCQPIQLTVDKPTFKADGVDVAKVTGIPLQSLVSVFFNNQMQAQETMVDDALELTAAAPGKYRIEVTCARHLQSSIVVEAK
jgi:hypothetical protein